MNEAAAIPFGFRSGPPAVVDSLQNIGEQFAFLRLPVSPEQQQPIDVVRNIVGILDKLVSRAIAKKSAAEFKKARKAVFPDYARAIRSLSDIARVVIEEPVREELAQESFSSLESQLEEEGDAFGSVVRDQALFTVWTFRKIDSLIKEITQRDAPEDLRELDDEYAEKFRFFVLWTRFHLDCLTVSLRTDVMISASVRDVIAEGLRGAVNAYAHAKQGLRLRREAAVDERECPPWDAEDQELLDASMDDLESEVH